jgi:hypothetical protein
MNKVKVNGNHGFVGHEGQPVWLAEHDEFDANHPLVQARPELFDGAPESPKRPVLSKDKPKGADD